MDDRPIRAGGVFVTFARGGSGPGSRGDAAWAAAVVVEEDRLLETAVVTGEAGAPYRPGLLALREGPLLEAAVRSLRTLPEVVLVNGTGRDHPRRCGLAVHVGAVIDVPTVGVTDRPLLGAGEAPGPFRGDSAPLLVDGALVALRVCTRAGVRPLVAHAAWRTEPATARSVLLRLARSARTPEPLRLARHLARTARSHSDPWGRPLP